MKRVYLLFDTEKSELIRIFSSREGAERDAYDYLESLLSFEEWEDYAEEHGYKTVKEFKEALLIYGDFYDDMGLEIIVEELYP